MSSSVLGVLSFPDVLVEVRGADSSEDSSLESLCILIKGEPLDACGTTERGSRATYLSKSVSLVSANAYVLRTHLLGLVGVAGAVVLS